MGKLFAIGAKKVTTFFFGERSKLVSKVDNFTGAQIARPVNVRFVEDLLCCATIKAVFVKHQFFHLFDGHQFVLVQIVFLRRKKRN